VLQGQDLVWINASQNPTFTTRKMHIVVDEQLLLVWLYRNYHSDLAAVDIEYLIVIMNDGNMTRLMQLPKIKSCRFEWNLG
jgi:hypothetical protein